MAGPLPLAGATEAGHRGPSTARWPTSAPWGAGIRAYFPLYIGEAGERTRPYYGSSRSRYDAARDVYHCPQDHPLRRTKADHTKEM